MSTFKCKPDKVKYQDCIGTLDTIHKKTASEFNFRRNNVNDLKQRRDSLENELKVLKIQDFSDSLAFIKKRSSTKDELLKIKNDIYDIENNVSELEYYSKIDEILFDYYNDNKNNIHSAKHINDIVNNINYSEYVDYVDSSNNEDNNNQNNQNQNNQNQNNQNQKNKKA